MTEQPHAITLREFTIMLAKDVHAFEAYWHNGNTEEPAAFPFEMPEAQWWECFDEWATHGEEKP